jgi:hypothetical protein
MNIHNEQSQSLEVHGDALPPNLLSGNVHMAEASWVAAEVGL